MRPRRGHRPVLLIVGSLLLVQAVHARRLGEDEVEDEDEDVDDFSVEEAREALLQTDIAIALGGMLRDSRRQTLLSPILRIPDPQSVPAVLQLEERSSTAGTSEHMEQEAMAPGPELWKPTAEGRSFADEAQVSIFGRRPKFRKWTATGELEAADDSGVSNAELFDIESRDSG